MYKLPQSSLNGNFMSLRERMPSLMFFKYRNISLIFHKMFSLESGEAWLFNLSSSKKRWQKCLMQDY